MATKMIVVILTLTYAGIWMDEHIPLSFDLFTLLGALLGSILGIYSAVKDLTR